LKNIQTNKQAALKTLTIQYARADKAKTSFGYIGITFLSLLFGSIFLNDLLKTCLHYFGGSRERWWEKKRKQREEKEKEKRVSTFSPSEVTLEMDRVYLNELENDLERVYFKLVKVNATTRRNC